MYFPVAQVVAARPADSTPLQSAVAMLRHVCHEGDNQGGTLTLIAEKLTGFAVTIDYLAGVDDPNIDAVGITQGLCDLVKAQAKAIADVVAVLDDLATAPAVMGVSVSAPAPPASE